MNLHRDAKIQETATPLDLVSFCEQPFSEKNGIVPESLDTSATEMEMEKMKTIEEQAKEIYESGGALDYICDSIGKFHKGDQIQVRLMVLSYAGTRVRNGKGIHVMITGTTGKGKSDITNKVLMHLPKYAHDEARYSDKALFYHPIPNNQVLVFDDQALSMQMQECIKTMTTNIKIEHKYKTVGELGKAREFCLPANCVIWISKVEMNGDEQIQNRCHCVWIDESDEQDAIIRAHQNAAVKDPDIALDRSTIDISLAIWDCIQKEEETVVIPYADDIVQKNMSDHRRYEHLLDVIKASAVMASATRNRNAKGYIEASISDLETACRIENSIIEGVCGSIDGKVRANEEFLHDVLLQLPSDIYFRYELMEKAHISKYTLCRYLRGIRNRETNEYSGGLFETCPGLDEADSSPDGRCKRIKWNREEYLNSTAMKNPLFAMEPDRRDFWLAYEQEKATGMQSSQIVASEN